MITLDQISDMSSRARNRSLTDADKTTIAELSQKWRIPFNPQTRCNQCWIDQTILLTIHARKLIRKYGQIDL